MEKKPEGIIINPIIEQTIYYGIVMLITIFLVGIFQKGFFFYFLRCKLSFGRLILIKLRAINRDHYAVGRIEEGFLIFKSPAGTKRLKIKDSSFFYKSIGIMWVDINEETNALCKADYTTVSGFDPIKHEELLIRALYKPGLNDKTQKIMIGLLVLVVSGLVVLGFLVYKNGTVLQGLTPAINNLNSKIAGVITGGNV